MKTLLILNIMLALSSALSAQSSPVQGGQDRVAAMEISLRELLAGQSAADPGNDTAMMSDEPQAITCSTNATSQKAVNNYNKIWRNGIVYYDFWRSLGRNGERIVNNAIAEYERRTCLRFRRATSGARVRFTGNTGRGCYSDNIGKRPGGGIQFIYLPTSDRCQWYPTALHEIGHAIGFFHEQSRPDRDRYVTIHRNNVRNNQRFNFNINYGIDYQGEPYDYRSIMHYPEFLFSANGRRTISVNNRQEYNNQGRPALGGARHLSAGDVRTVNKLYGCYNRQGRAGTLRIQVRRATGLPFTDRYYAEVVPASTKGYAARRSTRNNNNGRTRNPEWYILFNYGNARWRYFEIYIYRSSNNRLAIGRQTIWTDQEYSQEQYCVGANECVYLRYSVR